MCVIVDANVGHEVFGPSQSEAGAFLLNQIRPDRKQLVVGGELLRELTQNHSFVTWLGDAQEFGLARQVRDDQVDAETETLQSQGICRSNDEHVIALARVSGARLLFTNDNALQDDFRDRRIVGGTQGRIYTTQLSGSVSRTHRDLLSRRDLCDG